LPAWSGFLKTEQIGQIDAFLKRLYKYLLCSELMHLEAPVGESDKRLYYKMCNQALCLHFVLSPPVSAASVLRAIRMNYPGINMTILANVCPTVFVQFCLN